MPKFYFTYGSDEKFPFQNGWTEVHAENMGQAESFFRAAHPDKTPGILNCSWVYTQEKFEETDCFKKGNFGAGCHEVIGCFNPSKEILDAHCEAFNDALGNDDCGVAAGQYFGSIDFAMFFGAISVEEAEARKKDALDGLVQRSLNKIKKKPENSTAKCCFCGEPLPTMASQNNAKPVKDGVCCLKCNITIVAPARARLAKEGYNYD